jgi:hypothetical protein
MKLNPHPLIAATVAGLAGQRKLFHFTQVARRLTADAANC